MSLRQKLSRVPTSRPSTVLLSAFVDEVEAENAVSSAQHLGQDVLR